MLSIVFWSLVSSFSKSPNLRVVFRAPKTICFLVFTEQTKKSFVEKLYTITLALACTSFLTLSLSLSMYICSPNMKLIYRYTQPFWQTARKDKCENELFIFRQMAEKSPQQPKGKISVALGGRQISQAFLIKIGMLPGMHRFFYFNFSITKDKSHTF